MRLTPLIIKLHILQTLKLTLRNQRVTLRSHVFVGGPGVKGEDVGGSVLYIKLGRLGRGEFGESGWVRGGGCLKRYGES